MINESIIKEAIKNAVGILEKNLGDFTYKFQDSNSVNNFYKQSDNVEWTTGFCTGEYWLAYELTNDERFKNAGLVQTDSFMERIEKKIDVDHHDMGFLYSPSCVAAYRLTGSEIGKKAALLAADNMLTRFREKGQFFQAWGELGAKDNYRFIIDCLLNLPLLYWATEETGNEIYREKALAHTETALKHIIRPDSSTYHTYYFDPTTGAPLKGVTAQGFKDSSAWARGQAWGVYGLALCYKYSGSDSAIELYKKVTDFFIERLPADYVPFWDLDFTEKDNEPKDSSSAAIAACGMLEMSKYLNDEKYVICAKKIARSLAENYAVKDSAESNGLLLHGVYAKKSPFNTVTDRGVDECSTWGDYFWLELLTRLSRDWNIYW